jgi:hypothetical protein
LKISSVGIIRVRYKKDIITHKSNIAICGTKNKKNEKNQTKNGMTIPRLGKKRAMPRRKTLGHKAS